MSSIIQHNIMALNANRQLGVNNSSVAKSLEKLSSGYKINRAGDNAAGLTISEKMRSQIKGMKTAIDNANDGISLIQTAEGSLSEVHDMLNRMTEISTQAANGTYQDVDRDELQKEMEALNEEINRISKTTNFNGIKLLDGTMGDGNTGASMAGATIGTTNAFDFKVTGAESGVTVAFATGAGAGATDGTVSAAWNGNTLTFTLASADATGKVTQKEIDAAIKAATGTKPAIAGDIKVELDKDITFTAITTAVGASATTSTAVTAGAEKASFTHTGTGITLNATKAGSKYNIANAVVATAGASEGAIINNNGTVALSLKTGTNYTAAEINKILKNAGADFEVAFEGSKTSADVATALTTATTAGGAGIAGSGMELQVGETSDPSQIVNVSLGDMSAVSLGTDALDISKLPGARDAIDVIDRARKMVSSARADLGAVQNRLEHTVNNLGVAVENTTAAESRIRDVDMAEEMMNFTKNSVLTQAATAMLAQANQQPQTVLQLLQ